MPLDTVALDDWIRKLRANREWLISVMPEVARAVEAHLRSTAAAGTTPDGEAWAPKKHEGGRALPDAASAITLKPQGTVLLIKLGYPYGFHNGAKEGGAMPRRQVIPRDRTPASVNEVINATLVKLWEARL